MIRGRSAASLAISSALTLGCAPGKAPEPQALELWPFVYAEPGVPLEPLAEGDAVELWHAPQGGFVLPIGARIFGLDSATMQIRARLLEADGAVVAEHVRTALVSSVVGEPGWVENDRRSITQFAHVPACPPLMATHLLDRALTLDVHVIELHSDDSEGSSALRVMLQCPSDELSLQRACECECRGPEGSACDEPAD